MTDAATLKECLIIACNNVPVILLVTLSHLDDDTALTLDIVRRYWNNALTSANTTLTKQTENRRYTTCKYGAYLAEAITNG